jgi:hypothetical protein
MNQTTAIPEDSFEKARSAFFGKSNAQSNQSSPEAGAMTARNEAAQDNATQLPGAAASC